MTIDRVVSDLATPVPKHEASTLSYGGLYSVKVQ